MATYLDTTAFDHLYKKIGCTSSDIANLRRKIYGRELSIPLSIHTLEEILLDRKARPELLVAKIKLTLSIGNLRRMVKPCNQLIADDLRAYATTGEASHPFIDTDLQNIITTGISELVETDGEDLDEDMIDRLEQARRERQQFLAVIDAMIQYAQRSPAAIPWETGFAGYFAIAAPPVACELANLIEVGAGCARRGIEGVLGLRSIRMTIGAVLSIVHARLFEQEPTEAHGPEELLHATSAAAVADTLVSDSIQLRRAVSRVPLEKFDSRDLPGFLAELR